MNYSNKTVFQLKEICRKLEIKGISRKNKKQLIELLQLNEKKETSPVLEPKTDLKTKPLKKVVSAMSSIIEKVYEYISSIDDSNINLLRIKEVVQWIYGDLSFLPSIENKNKKLDEEKYKVLEDKWGRITLKNLRPDLKLDKQWTNVFGEIICKEIYYLLDKIVKKPVKKNNHQPDWEIDDSIVEVKTGTFHTAGTAGEKILGCPFKYADVPDLYGKPLKIMCIGGAEKVSRESYGNLPGTKCSKQKKKFLDFFRENQIEYIGASDILRSISSSN